MCPSFRLSNKFPGRILRSATYLRYERPLRFDRILGHRGGLKKRFEIQSWAKKVQKKYF